MKMRRVNIFELSDDSIESFQKYMEMNKKKEDVLNEFVIKDGPVVYKKDTKDKIKYDRIHFQIIPDKKNLYLITYSIKDNKDDVEKKEIKFILDMNSLQKYYEAMDIFIIFLYSISIFYLWFELLF